MSQNAPKRPRVNEEDGALDPLTRLIEANISLQQQLAAAAKDARLAAEDARLAAEATAKANARADAIAEDARLAAEATAKANERAEAAVASANERADATVAKANERADAAVASANERADAAVASANERADAAAEDTRRAFSVIATAVGAMAEMVSMARQNVENVHSIRASETRMVRYITNEDVPVDKRFVCVTFEHEDEITSARFIDTDSLDETEEIATRRPTSKRTRTICAVNAFETEEMLRDHGNLMLKRHKIESVS
jgi:hypothetical protein